MKIKLVVFMALALITISCATTSPGNHNEKFAGIVESNQLTAKHASYFRKKYITAKKDEGYYASLAFMSGEVLQQAYSLVNIKITKKDIDNPTGNPIIPAIKLTKKTLNTHLSSYSSVWSNAIKNHVGNEYYNVDFSTALSITKYEYSRIGVFDEIDLIQKNLLSQLEKYHKNEFPETYGLYAILTQLIELARNPSGSLMTFNSTVNRLNIEFTKTLTLAEFEHKA